MRGVGSRAPIPLVTIGILAVASCGGEAREADVAADALTSTTLASVETRTSLDVEDGDDFTAGDDGESSGPAVSLAGTLWILVSGLEVVDGYEPSLLFGSGGHDGCNGFGADYDVSGTSLTITMRYITTVGCSGDRAVVAEAFQGAIAVADSYEVSGDQLMLRGPTVELVFEAPPAIDLGQVVDVIWLLDELVHEGERLLVEGSVGFLELRSDGTFVGSTGCRELSGRWQGAAANVVGFADLAAEGTCRPSLVD
ncbi:MAG: META domain-containing protein, partial [bacterium]|nr:META domain-containing protein [bacterium]